MEKPVIVIFGESEDERDEIARAIRNALRLSDRTDDRIPRLIGSSHDYYRLSLSGRHTTY